ETFTTSVVASTPHRFPNSILRRFTTLSLGSVFSYLLLSPTAARLVFTFEVEQIRDLDFSCRAARTTAQNVSIFASAWGFCYYSPPTNYNAYSEEFFHA